MGHLTTFFIILLTLLPHDFDPPKNIPPYCTQSNRDYSYQSLVDPGVVRDEWFELKTHRRGSFPFQEFYFKNPNKSHFIQIAVLLVEQSIVTGICYLVNNDPDMFIFNRDTRCYERVLMTDNQRDNIRKLLLRALGVYSV